MSWSEAFLAPFKRLPTIIWDHETPALRVRRPPTSVLWRNVCHLSSFSFFLPFFLLLPQCHSRNQLLSLTVRAAASEVPEDEARLIVRGRKARSKSAHSSDKMLFLFSVPLWREGVGGARGGISLITSAISVVPANPPITFLSGADSSRAPWFPLEVQHLRSQLSRTCNHMYCVCACSCGGVIGAKIKIQNLLTHLTHEQGSLCSYDSHRGTRLIQVILTAADWPHTKTSFDAFKLPRKDV